MSWRALLRASLDLALWAARWDVTLLSDTMPLLQVQYACDWSHICWLDLTGYCEADVGLAWLVVGFVAQPPNVIRYKCMDAARCSVKVKIALSQSSPPP